MNIILKNFEDTKTNLIKRRANRDAVAHVLAVEKENIEELKAKVTQLQDGISLMQNFTNTLRSDVVTKFEDLLTKGARHVFQEDYKVTIEFTNAANSVYADFYVTLPNGRKINILNGEGGGLKDFVAVLQRMLYIILEPSLPSRLIFIDESFKALDGERAQSAFKFISELAHELGIQIVFITHADAARAMSDTEGVSVLHVAKIDGVSQAKLIHSQGEKK